MWREIVHTMPGPGKVTADFGRFSIPTDHPGDGDRSGRAPEPWMLFLASIGTCAASFVAAYLSAHDVPLDAVRIVQRQEFVDGERLRIELAIEVPPEVAAEHRAGILEVAGECTVMRTIEAGPEIRLEVAPVE